MSLIEYTVRYVLPGGRVRSFEAAFGDDTSKEFVVRSLLQIIRHGAEKDARRQLRKQLRATTEEMGS